MGKPETKEEKMVGEQEAIIPLTPEQKTSVDVMASAMELTAKEMREAKTIEELQIVLDKLGETMEEKQDAFIFLDEGEEDQDLENHKSFVNGLDGE